MVKLLLLISRQEPSGWRPSLYWYLSDHFGACCYRRPKRNFVRRWRSEVAGTRPQQKKQAPAATMCTGSVLMVDEAEPLDCHAGQLSRLVEEVALGVAIELVAWIR